MYRMINEDVYIVGGPGYSSPSDCLIYMVDCTDGLVMIDSGCGESFSAVEENVIKLGREIDEVKALILTHCHIDHIGGASAFKKATDCKIYAHELDADAIEGRNPRMTAQRWYGIDYIPVKVDVRIKNDEKRIICGREFQFIYTPGHTPGSISVLINSYGKRILFAQDVHGPFHEDFESNIDDWKKSLRKLLSLNADVLCEGHYGVFRPAAEVKRYIESYLGMYD